MATPRNGLNEEMYGLAYNQGLRDAKNKIMDMRPELSGADYGLASEETRRGMRKYDAMLCRVLENLDKIPMK